MVVADQQALAGGLVAERLGVPWATSATTSAEFTDVLAGLGLGVIVERQVRQHRSKSSSVWWVIQLPSLNR